MEFKLICDSIFRLYLYADVCKMIHYSTRSNHEHELSDSIRDEIISFADELAEGFFGFFGKPKFGDMSIDVDIQKTNDLGKLCQLVVNVVEPIRTQSLKNDKLSGIVSIIDDFKQTMSKNAFLATFDKVSNYTMKK